MNSNANAIARSAVGAGYVVARPPLLRELPSVPNPADGNQTEVGGDDEYAFYDLYQSPCRGVLRASNDELLDFVDLGEMNDDAERNHITSYGSKTGKTGIGATEAALLYQNYGYYYDDLEYCGATFYGGCDFGDRDELATRIRREEEALGNGGGGGEPFGGTLPSFVNWTVVYDYEIHYTGRGTGSTNRAPQTAWFYSNETRAGVVSQDRQKARSSELLREQHPQQQQQQQQQQQAEEIRGRDPIPAVEHLETIVLEHLSEVVGLSRRGCGSEDPAQNRTKTSYHHDFTDDELKRMMAISSNPMDVLDPDHAECTVPVASTIGQKTDCVPVSGAIRIYLNTTDIPSHSLEDLKLSIQSGFQRLIRFGMQHGLYLSDDSEDDDRHGDGVVVSHVSFIGTRIPASNNESGEVAPAAETKAENSRPQSTSSLFMDQSEDLANGDKSTTNAVLVVVASLGVIFAAIIAAFGSGRRKRNNGFGPVDAGRDGVDEETGLVATAGEAVPPVLAGMDLLADNAEIASVSGGFVKNGTPSISSDATVADAEVYDDNEDDDDDGPFFSTEPKAVLYTMN